MIILPALSTAIDNTLSSFLKIVLGGHITLITSGVEQKQKSLGFLLPIFMRLPLITCVTLF